MHVPEPRCFIDANVWLYAFIENGETYKSSQARAIMQTKNITVSIQVINEVCVNLVKKVHTTEAEVRQIVKSFYQRYTVVPLDQATALKASEIRERHSFSFWDSLIVASAILAGVDVLYSEDMQDGFEIENVRIVNPFSS
jgi:predicted nucleic acid-binding protein